MMGRNTRPSTTRLWTGLATLLLITGLVSSQDPSTLSVASSPNAEAITERLSGSVASLRNVDSISDVASTTLKSVKVIPESSINRTKVDESPDGLTTESNVAHKVERLLENKSEKLKVKEPLTRPQASDVAEEKKQSTNGSLQEFSENEDNEKIEDLEDDNDREPTTRPPKKEKPKEKIPEIGVSLLNDTNVNYNEKKSVKNTKDEGVFGEDSDNPKNTLENATNVIVSGGEAADDNGRGKGPKSQVEVVKNSTLPKVLRISEAEVVEERKDVGSLGSAEQEVNKTIDNNANLWSTNLTNSSEKRVNSTLGNRDNVEGDRNEDKKASQSPKGRTISFGGTNEFITNDNKTEGLIRDNEGINDNSSNEMTSSVTKEAIREEISTDFKPYPYVKTNFHPNSTSILSSGSLEIRESTEEAAALENTIGQSKENKKIVVTEASVVIDNSIQHFKPTYYKRSGNVTRIASTSDITKATAAPSLGSEEASSTTLSSNPLALENATTIFLSSLPLSNTENDVPRGNEASESSGGLKETNSSVDIIGNGITEIVAGIKNISVVEFNATTASLPLPSSSVSQTRATEQISVQNSTEIIGTSNEEVTLADFDTQTIAGLSMTNISAFNVTEGSSRIGSNQSDTNDVESTSALSITTLMPDTSSQLISTSVHSSLSTSGAFNTTSMSPLVGNDSSESNSNEQNSGATITETSTVSMTILNVSAVPNPIDYSESTAIPTTASMTSKVTSSTSLTTEGSDNSTYFASEEPTDAISTTTPKTVESFGPNDQLESTTSNIEYVFVGLTESTASQRYIATSESSNAVTLDSELSSSTSSNVIEASTFSQTSDVGSTTIGMTNSSESFLATEQPEPSSEEPNVTKLTVENDTNLDSTTILSYIEVTTLEDSTISEFDTTTIVPDLATIFKNESVDSTTEQIIPAINSTNSYEIISDSNENSTDTGRGVDSFTTVPNVTGSKVENVSETIIGSSERSNISNTSESPELSVSTTIPDANFTLGTPAINSTSEKSIKDQIVNNDETNSNFSESATKPTTSSPKSDIDSTSEDASDVVTDDAIEMTARGVPSLVKVVFDGSWADVCPHLDALRQSLADLLTSGLEKSVLASQIIFQNNPCSEGFEASAITTESSITTLLLYVVDEKGNFDSEMTKTLPSLYSKSPIKLQVNIRSFQLVQDSDSGNAIAVVVVSCVALICLVVLAGLLFIMRKRQTRFNYGERCRPVSLDAYSLDSVSAYNSVRRKGAARASKRSYGNPTFEDSSAIPSHPLNFAGLSTFCNEQNAISEEFAGIPQVTARIDELPQGAEVKNRYANVVPLPETRVSLIKINNDPLTEYINASYVRGPKNATKYYIACQAPIESTVTDFWRMIWEQQSKVVIMLTDLVENGVEKCAEYIPPSEVTDCHRLFGDFQVTLKKRETKEKYAISTLHLKNLENNTFREISHIWYLWPANGVQSDAAGLIAVLLEARALQRGGPGPIVVHCSPGTGRTGTLIALDLGIRQYEITRTVDVPRVVYTIRRDRAGAVQTKEQYAFIYKALNLYATKLAGGALES